MRGLSLFILAAVACDPGVRDEYILRGQREPLKGESSGIQGITISRALAAKYRLLAHVRAGDYCDLLSATGSDEARGHSVMLRLCVRSLDSSRLSIAVLEAFTDQWGSRGDSLRHELHDTLSVIFGPALRAQ